MWDEALCAVMTMVTVADRLEMTEVVKAIEDAIIGQLSVGLCCDGLMWALVWVV